jgi:putative membrane protein
MSKFTFAAAFGSLLLTASLVQAHDSMATSQDGLFVVLATEGGMTEIETSKLARDRSTNPEILAFAQRMIDDHRAINRHVEKAADRADVYVPCDLDKGHQAEVDMLEDIPAASFDRLYREIQDKEHREAVMAFSEEAKMGQEPGLMEVAANAQATLDDHQKMVQGLEAKMGVPANALPSMADKPPMVPKT